jgi:zinc/manganese transport system permease protein
VGILSGIAASARYDLPSGASIVITLFIAGMLFNLLLQPWLQKAQPMREERKEIAQ